MSNADDEDIDGPKIYLVTSGSYSDYAVDLAFEAREDAERWATLRESHVEVFPFVPAGAAPVMRTIWKARWWSSRDDVDVSSTLDLGKSGDFHNPAKTTTPNSMSGEYLVYADGTDRERVTKSVADKRAECLARRAELS